MSKRSWNAPRKNASAVPAEAVAAAGASQTAASSSGAGLQQPTGVMWWVRQARTFNPRVFIHKHTFGVYWSFVAVFFVYANYLQHQRMKKLYPDYDVVARKSGQQYGSMKEQELVDVQAFNAKASNMRQDIRARL